MGFWQRWVQRPQGLWVRKAIFQVHLWVGIGVGLYVLLISLSGSAVVYRRELSRALARKAVLVVESGAPLSLEELRQTAQRLYPEHKVDEVFEARDPNQPTAIVLERGQKRMQRLFDPYTGEDLGDPLSRGLRVVEWWVDLHDNLLFGRTGRFVNGIGAILVTVLSLTGSLIWWPGIMKWRRSLTISWKAKPARFNWELHSAMGFWFLLFALMWGITGIYFSFPEPFNALFEFLDPNDPSSRGLSLGDKVLPWFARLHFGRFRGWLQVLWTVLGLVPVALFVTGVIMWWNRVLRKGASESE